MHRRTLLGGAAGLAAITAAMRVPAQTAWPERPLRLVVPFPPGGPIDVLGRIFAVRLGERLGQPVAVENKAGAAGAIGAADIARSRSDGYSLLVGTASTHGLYPLLAKKPLYDARSDFTPLALIGSAPVAFAVNPAMPDSLAGLLAEARARPGKLRYGSPGTGSLLHLTTELLMLRAGKVDIVHVPYRGSAPALNDLIGGHIEMMPDTIGTALPQHRAGRTRILAVATERRLALAADIATVNEALGVSDFAASLWSLLAAPPGLPAAVRDRLIEASAAILSDPAYAAELEKLGIVAVPPLTPPQLSAFLDAELARYRPVVEATGISIE